MTKELAFIMRNKLANIPFLDVVAGIVQPVIDVKMNQDNNLAIAKKMPVSYDVTGKGTAYGMERQLVPDQSKKSILYFEDFGSTTDTTARARTLAFITNIRLVFWMNKINCGFDKYADISAFCINSILERLILPSGINQSGITRLFISNPRILIQDSSVFSRYNYTEEVVQYLRPPFEFFAIDLTCKYTVHGSCLGGLRVSSDLVPTKIPILIKDVPSNTKQLLDNGFFVRSEYPSGPTLTVDWLKGFNILAPFILNRRNIDGIEDEPIPFNPVTMTWDFSTMGIKNLNDGDEIFINAALPKVLN